MGGGGFQISFEVVSGRYQSIIQSLVLVIMINFQSPASFLSGGRFVDALAADGVINEEMLSGSELERIYSPLREQISDSVLRQEKVLANIQVC